MMLAGIADRAWTLLDADVPGNVAVQRDWDGVGGGRRVHARPAGPRPPGAGRGDARAEHVVPLFVFDDAILRSAVQPPEPDRVPARVPARSRRLPARRSAARWSCGAATGCDEVAAVAQDVGADSVHAQRRRHRVTPRARLDALRGRGRTWRCEPHPGVTVVEPGAVTPAIGRPLPGVHAVLPAVVGGAPPSRSTGPRARRRSPDGVDPGPLPSLADLVDRRSGRPTSSRAARPRATRALKAWVDVRPRRVRRPPRRPPRRRDLAHVAAPALRLPLTARDRARRCAAGRGVRRRSSVSSAGATSTRRSSPPGPTPPGPTTAPAAIAGTTTPTPCGRGTTAAPGYPVVDAAMRQLQAEGFVHNRARMIVASFLTKDLYVDWRVGAAPLPRPAGRRRHRQQQPQLAVDRGHRHRHQPAPHLQPHRAGAAVRPRRRLRAPIRPRARGVTGGAVHEPDDQVRRASTTPSRSSTTASHRRVQGPAGPAPDERASLAELVPLIDARNGLGARVSLRRWWRRTGRAGAGCGTRRRRRSTCRTRR